MAAKRKSAKKPVSAKKVQNKVSAKVSSRRAVSVAASSENKVAQRVAAAAQAPLAIRGNEKDFRTMLKVLGNTAEPVRVRLSALQSLQAASFSVLAFAPFRRDYIAGLRKIAQDPDPELRQRVLGLLARAGDGFAVTKLVEGLRNPAKALLPPEKALQLLSYDPHAEGYAVARDILTSPPSEIARREALRLLAADATAAPMFEKLMRDKNELREIRQLAASALHALDPQALQKCARDILLDESDYDDIKSTSLTALSQFGGGQSLKADRALIESVDRFRISKTSKDYKQVAAQFLDKYGS